ncbi:hypothetical protein [Alkalicoccobacillus plakortidis]|uniref:DUF3221 domain-containing protein n=1 Tax=Alkalicoccobacillus plakortidis TaxID=444060 RepID=A0ABT0XQA2_9BACI|nr:hypothetical protein [Alkalicoccobacillus plakortidis]MCM2677429.1 hypothetical protein [Alkalicoccobacillus plakortidis]
MSKKVFLFISILILASCSYDISGAAFMEVTERLEDGDNYYTKVKNQGGEIYTLEIDENVFNLIEVGSEYFISYKSNNDKVGELETIEPK